MIVYYKHIYKQLDELHNKHPLLFNKNKTLKIAFARLLEQWSQLTQLAIC